MTRYQTIKAEILGALKAVAGGVVAGAAYVAGSGWAPQDATWWAGMIVFVGAGFGFVYGVKNR